MKFLKIFPIGLGYLKLLFYKTIYGRRLEFHGIPRVCPDIIIHIDKNAKIIIGKNFSSRHNLHLRATKNGILSIKNNVFFSDDVKITCQKRIEIGADVIVGQNTFFYDHDHMIKKDNTISKDEFVVGDIVIGDGCWIGAMCCILKNVFIENNSIIGAGTIVLSNTISPKNSLIVNEKKVKILSIKRENNSDE